MSFAQDIRNVIRDQIGDREFTALDIGRHLDLITRDARQPIYSTLSDMTRRGEIVRIRDGVYRRAVQKPSGPVEKQRKMWHLLRARRLVTVDDMVALAGVKAGYAKEFFQGLARQGVVKRIPVSGNKPSKYQMITDPVKMPPNKNKLVRLRRIRAAKKRASAAIDQAAESMIGATEALARLKTALGDLSEEDDADL